MNMSQVSNQETRTTDNSKYRKAIVSTTSRMTNVIKQHIALLDDRAMAYGMLADFTSAQADIDEMMHLDPSSVKPYVRASELFCIRGNQLQAIKICKEGLKNVDEHDRGILEQYCAMAAAKANQRYDILGMVPEEIIPEIIQHLTSRERLTLLDVSKLWRNRLSECSPIWSRIKIDEIESQSVRKDISLLACVSHHILELELFRLSNEFCELVLSLMTGSNFEKLKKFAMEDCKLESSQILFDAIPCVAETLQELHILVDYADSTHPAIPFKSLLSTCRNLTKFSYRHLYTVLGKTTGMLEPMCMSKLTHLTLRLPFNDETLDVEEIVRGCPKLRMLFIGFIEATAIEAIRQHCNNLEALYFNIELVGDYSMCTKASESSTSGVRELALWVDEPSHFIPFFTDHSRSIERLEISDDNSSDEGWQALLNVCDFRNLRGLTLCRPGELGLRMADVLRKSLALESLGIHAPRSFLGDLVQPVSQLRYLRSLDLKYCDAEAADFQALFLSLATKGQEATLQKVILMENRFPLDGIIEYLSDIPTIQYIELSDGGRSSEQSINTFARKLRQHPAITSIKFIGVRNVTDTTLCHLSAVKPLETLHLWHLPLITSDGLQYFNKSVGFHIEECFGLRSM